MPGHQQLRFMQPTDYFRPAEPIYGQVKQKKTSKGKHPLFEDLKSRHTRERAEYERYIKFREMPPSSRKGDFNPYNKFDSLKLIGSCNDINYLDQFMSMPRQRPPSDKEEYGGRTRPKPLSKSSSTVFGKGHPQSQHRNSIQSDTSAMTSAVLANLRGTSSDDNLYESVEMIHYKKTIQNLDRIKKTRSVQKTGHPLFDHLRVEQALKGPSVRKNSNARSEYVTSDGNSPSHSSSSSGDEYDTYPRVLVKHPRHQQQKQNGPSLHDLNKAYLQQLQQMPEAPVMGKKHDKQQKPQQQPIMRKKRTEQLGSESDEDWIIPRPKILSGRMGQQQRRVDIPSSGADESDSSVNSAVLR